MNERSASALPPITAEFLASTISSAVKNVVNNVKFPVMGGGSYLAEAAKSYSKLASKSETPEKTAQAFSEKANNGVDALAFNTTVEQNFASGVFMPGKSNDTGRA